MTINSVAKPKNRPARRHKKSQQLHADSTSEVSAEGQSSQEAGSDEHPDRPRQVPVNGRPLLFGLAIVAFVGWLIYLAYIAYVVLG